MSADRSARTPFYEQLLNGLQASQGPPKLRPSAAVVPWRQTDGGDLEVYWVRRNPALRFMGGWHAFPGGGLSRRDATLPVRGVPQGIEPQGRSPASGSPQLDRTLAANLIDGLVACALRELFEETGLLLHRGVDSVGPDALHEGRQRLLAKEVGFAALLAAWQTELDAGPLHYAGRWLTPPLAPMGFDNRFFLLHWPADRPYQPSILEGELVHGEWIRADHGVERWRRSQVLMAPPILHLLKSLAEDGPQASLPRLQEPRETFWGTMRHIEFRPGVHLLPLRTPTLPPATHTNAFLLGHRDMVLVDPATPFEDEQERLLEALQVARGQGATLRAIWLSHHHIDHVGAVERLRRELDLPVFAHGASRGPLAQLGIRLDGELQHGQRVVLEGDPPFAITVHHTPGHTRGHLCFLLEEHGSLIAGDLVSALSTIVIDPPEGNMGDYLASLEAMLELRPRLLFPSHGPVILDAMAKLEEFHSHRLEREQQVLALWQQGERDTAAMVRHIYPDLPPMVHGIAQRQVLAHLERLAAIEGIEWESTAAEANAAEANAAEVTAAEATDADR